jgi:hypothetical protein
LPIAETVLIFAGIPVAIVAVVYALVYGASGRRTSKRYRPGRPFAFMPVWFVAAGPDSGAPAGARAVTAGTSAPALGAGGARVPKASHGDADATRYGETGGASDSW